MHVNNYANVFFIISFPPLGVPYTTATQTSTELYEHVNPNEHCNTKIVAWMCDVCWMTCLVLT